MNTQQARALIGETFPQTFDKERFRYFAVNLLNHIDETKAQAWNTTYIKDAFKPHVHKFERLGTYTSPDKEKLDVLIVHLTTESKLGRARTAIRDFVADYLKTRDNKDAALVAFVSPTEKQWRFSYVKMEYAAVEKENGKVGIQTTLTPARRSSYIVGEGESCHTAQSRFIDLLRDTENHPTLAQIENAFSVEAVTKEFFEQYKALFLDLNDELDNLAKKDKTIGTEFAAKKISTADFAKKLMGQIVFLYFLQKKGWLGLPKGGDWGDGVHDFLRQLFNCKFGSYKNFFNDILEPLFYDTLATDRGHDAWCKIFKCRIPFLNGGLFEPLRDYDWEKIDIPIPNSLFSNTKTTPAGDTGTGILDVFDRYNFTVNEAEPLEKEVAIDPEMLGKVFENLLEVKERKSKGSFYTPREIVHYMCQESLINYLDTALNTDKEIVPRKDIETFIYLGEQISHYEAVDARYPIKMPPTIKKYARLIDEKLATITVCDPAIGSGAFPVGMMQEIVRARSSLTNYFNDVHERTAYHFKRHAIKNCLYGVDIDPGAVEIAKLRLWLSLVVDEEDMKQIKPLPNLDYKIVVGNSLLGFPFKSQRSQRIEKLMADYVDETDHERKKRLKLEIDEELSQAFASSKRTLGYEVTFDFQIFFSEVFRAKQGFDVAIANPPYISVEKFASTVEQNAWKQRFKTYAGRGDIYCFFYEQGLNLLREGGVLTFISSNKFQRAGYGKGLRQLLAAQQIHNLIDFCELPVFVAATDPMIVIASKAPASAEREFPVLVVKDEAEFSSLTQSVAMRAFRYKPEQLKADGWSLEGEHRLALVEKLRAKGMPLGEYVAGGIMAGIKTGYNKAFWLDVSLAKAFRTEDREVAKRFIKPLLLGDDARRWLVKPITQFLIYTPRGTALADLGKLKSHLAKWRDRLALRALDQEWFELQQAQVRYSATYEKSKIVYPDIALEPRFSLDTNGRYPDMTAFSIPSGDHALVALLNSSALWFFLCQTAAVLGDADMRGRVRCKTQYVSRLPIPPCSPIDKAKLVKLAERAAESALAGEAAAVQKIERAIDEIVYRLFDLTADEISYIETSLANTRSASADDNDDGDE